MPVNVVIAVTDPDWYDTLRRQQPGLDEVNFWSPTPMNFHSLEPGELFLFKLRGQEDFIVGGGVFLHSNTMPWSLAWEAFGVGNGAETAEEMRARIVRLLDIDPNDRSDFIIGCRVLTQPFFLERNERLPLPPNWHRNIQRHKRFDTNQAEISDIWGTIVNGVDQLHFPTDDAPEPMFGEPRLIKPRKGQGAFRILVTDTYDRRCAITRERTLPALDAAHIIPHSIGGPHEASNGLLLRSDIHRLFDAGYVTVTPDLEFKVSDRIHEEYNNGKQYYELDGQRISEPNDSASSPDPDKLAWHNEECFRD